MISVLFLWQRLEAYSQKYQAGTDVVSYFNSSLAEVQAATFNDFSPFYDENEKVKSLLDFWVRQEAGTSSPDGSQSIGEVGEVVARPLGVGYTDGTVPLFGIPQASESELMAIARIPQRAPSVTKKNIYYRFNSPSDVQFYPSESIPYFWFYLIYPTEAHIAFIYTSTDDEDIMTYDPANSVDLGWPASATNLILYGMLEKYGVQVREEMLEEYSRYGLVKSTGQREVKNGN